ncbi:major facilitator superfamily domain-containing protein [Choanephora cucurbitarum]|nr:major facilitator superfamily domain-containing protein [Choanephora cucurbitarum]
MIRDFHITDENGIGYYTGLITACFAISQLLTGIPWGMLSDRIGRKPVILQGLVGSITSILLFGLSRSYVWALLSRSLCGLLNGNGGVIKSIVSELTIDHLPHKRAEAFSLITVVHGIGYILGPIIGGFLSYPVSQYPKVFGNRGALTDFLSHYPYFFPTFIAALICAIAFIACFFFLEETLLNKQKSDDHLRDSRITNEDIECSAKFTSTGKKASPTLREALTPSVVAVCVMYGCFVLQNSFSNVLYPLYTASNRDSGGLGFSPNEIGISLGFAGVVTIIGHVVLLPILVRKFGLLRLTQIALFLLIFVYLFQGVIRVMYLIPDPSGQKDTKCWVWVGLLIFLAFKTLCNNICYTGCVVLANNAAPRSDTLGVVNGFSQCCSAAMSAIGPTISSVIWSASLSATSLPYDVRINITFFVLTCIVSVTYILCRRLKPEKYEAPQA